MPKQAILRSVVPITDVSITDRQYSTVSNTMESLHRMLTAGAVYSPVTFQPTIASTVTAGNITEFPSPGLNTSDAIAVVRAPSGTTPPAANGINLIAFYINIRSQSSIAIRNFVLEHHAFPIVNTAPTSLLSRQLSIEPLGGANTAVEFVSFCVRPGIQVESSFSSFTTTTLNASRDGYIAPYAMRPVIGTDSPGYEAYTLVFKDQGVQPGIISVTPICLHANSAEEINNLMVAAFGGSVQ